VQKAIINTEMKSFNISDIDLDVFANSKSITISYNQSNGTFLATKGSQITPENIIVYNFDYETDSSNDYLCGNEESGIIKSFKTSNFNMNKTYIQIDLNRKLTLPLIHQGTKIVLPNEIRGLFSSSGNINITTIINILKDEEQKIKNKYNSAPEKQIKKLNILASKYNNEKIKSEKKRDDYGIGKSFDQIANDTIDKISNLSLSDYLINEEKDLTSLKKRTTYIEIYLDFKKDTEYIL